MAETKTATATKTKPAAKGTAAKKQADGNKKTAPAAKKTRTMADSHKQAIADGRTQSQAVRTYLDALEQTKPTRGRKRTTTTVTAQLEDVRRQLAEGRGETKLLLTQRELDLQRELERLGTSIDIAPLEAAFIEIAAAYSARKGVSYTAWRSVGVEPDVLAKAGIARTRTTTS